MIEFARALPVCHRWLGKGAEQLLVLIKEELALDFIRSHFWFSRDYENLLRIV
jgi:hypothetical protein